MNKKLKRMEIILVLAAFFIALANLGLFTNDFITSTISKGILGFIIPSLLLFISFEVEKNLKLETTSKHIQLISMISYFISICGVYFDLVNTYGVTNDFLKIGNIFINEFVFIPIFLIIICLIGIFLNKDITYKKLIILSTYFLFYYVLNTINKNVNINILGMKYGNCLFEYSILSIVVLIYNYLFNLKYSKCLSIANLFYTFYVIYNAKFDLETIVPALIITCISIFAFLIRIRKEESKAYDVIPFIGIMMFLMNLLSSYSEKLLILPIAIIIITDMLIVVFDIVKDKNEGLIFKVFLDILTLIALLIAIVQKTDLILIPVVVLASSLASTYALKSDYHEQYILPFKTVLCIIALLVELKNSIKMDPLIIVLIVNIFATIASYLSKNKVFKNMFLAVIFITYLYLLKIDSLIGFIIMSTIFIFDYLVLIIYEKRDTAFKIFYSSLIVCITLINLEFFKQPILYLVSSVLFICLYLASKERGIKVISSLAFLYSMTHFIGDLPISYEVTSTVNQLLVFGILYYLISTSKSLNNNIFKITLIVLNSLILWDNSSAIPILVSLAINVLLLIIYMKNNNIIFKTSAVLTILSIIFTLSLIDEVPTFVYLLVLGLVVVFVIYRKIQKYINEPHDEEKEEKLDKETKKTNAIYCTQCGNKLSSDSNFCPECGNKIRK